MVKPMSYKALFAFAAAQDWEIEQMDVKTAFLYGDLDEEIYIEQPEKSKNGTDRICLLKKALYGLKQSPRVWYHTLADFLREQGLEPLTTDCSVFHLNGTLFIAIYVDDLLLFGPNMAAIRALKRALSDRFQITDLGPVAYYLGMEVTRDRPSRTLWLGQSGYLERVLRDFGMWDCAPVGTPMDMVKLEAADGSYVADAAVRTRYQSAVGSLMYAIIGTRPDIAYAISVVNRYGSNPTDVY